MLHSHPDGDRSQCVYCRNNLPFDLPKDLYDAVLAGQLVLFAGAGVSTETSVMPVPSLYEDACETLAINPTDGPPFPDLMTQFVEKFDGRAGLLRKVKKHFDYIWSFSDLYDLATRFHAELATIFPLAEIITTNWDDYFERECGATPFVTADDFAFWNLPGRKALKIHGSVNSFGSIVATREDYERCYRRLSNGLLGSSLKMALATKTILYAGFSFRDDDFARIHRFLTKEMKGAMPRSYLVTLDRSSDSRLGEVGIRPIYTDATFFLSRLKAKLVTDEHMIADERYDRVPMFYRRVLQSHTNVAELSLLKYPDLIYCLAYQDGLKHALMRIMTLRKSGYYSHKCNVARTIASYSKQVRVEKVRAGEYETAAYVDGYINGLLYFMMDDRGRSACPIYYVFGCRDDLRSYAEFRRVLKDASRLHRAAHLRAVREVKTSKIKEGMVFHHPPVI